MKYWTNAVAPLRAQPDIKTAKILEIPTNALVECYEDHDGFLHVEYKGKFGYVANTLAEPYWETLPKNCVEIANQTPDTSDFEQYYIYKGVKQTNACGPLSICYALGLTLKDFMDTWEIEIPSLWKRVRGGGKFAGTTPQDLRLMCEAYTVPTEKMETVTMDAWLKRSRYTPRVLQKLALEGFPIVGCKIDAGTGRLRGQGVGHWVVVVKVEPERTGGMVTIYNPASNRYEEYQYDIFLASAPSPYGIYIKKDAV